LFEQYGILSNPLFKKILVTRQIYRTRHCSGHVPGADFLGQIFCLIYFTSIFIIVQLELIFTCSQLQNFPYKIQDRAKLYNILFEIFYNPDLGSLPAASAFCISKSSCTGTSSCSLAPSWAQSMARHRGSAAVGAVS